MNSDEFRYALLALLPNAKSAAGGKEIITDCPFCGKEGHLYISIPRNGKPSKYNCFKCPKCGNTKNILKNFGINNKEIEEFLSSHKEDMNGVKSYNRDKFKLFVPIEPPTEINILKLNYINSRLGINLSFRELAENKIFLNLELLLGYNKITRLTRDFRIVRALAENFIGFISIDNGYSNLRKFTDVKLHPSIDKRYIVYNISGEEDQKKFYVPPTTLDIYKKVTVHMSEGPFDILGVKYNVVGPYKDNQLFIAGGGKSYPSIIQMIIMEYGFIDLEFHVYMDNDDDSENKIINFAQKLYSIYGYNFYIHHNAYPGEKDYGVPRERIIDRNNLIV